MSRLTYLLTPWCRVLLENLTGLQLVKKFPAFHATRRFITALTSVRHLSLSRASPIQSIYSHSNSWRSILILSTHLRLGLPSGLLSNIIMQSVTFALYSEKTTPSTLILSTRLCCQNTEKMRCLTLGSRWQIGQLLTADLFGPNYL